MGVPFIGTVAIGTAAVFASQGELNIAVVLIVAAAGNEIGGLLGYKIGDHWGRRILEHPGPALQWRKKTITKGEDVYQKWGRLAVFFTPALVSGMLRMKFGQFAVWNFFAGAVFVLSVGPAAYGAGRLSSGHHDGVSVGMLVGGAVVGVLCVVLGVRHHRRYKARRSLATIPGKQESRSTARKHPQPQGAGEAFRGPPAGLARDDSKRAVQEHHLGPLPPTSGSDNGRS
jgi:membrane protein DedA with SNARE-associated domain